MVKVLLLRAYFESSNQSIMLWFEHILKEILESIQWRVTGHISAYLKAHSRILFLSINYVSCHASKSMLHMSSKKLDE